MTLYITTDDLSVRNKRVVVYATVFTCDVKSDGSIGSWYMIGENYLGTAPVIGYEGEDDTGSFHTDTWYSTRNTYTSSLNYSYTVENNVTIRDIIQAKDINAFIEMQLLLNRAVEIIESNAYAGEAILKLHDVFFVRQEFILSITMELM